MKNLVAEFKDDKDRMITLAMLILSLFFGFIPALIVVFIPNFFGLNLPPSPIE